MRVVFFIAVLLFGVQTAHADACKTQGSKDAKELTFNLSDKAVLHGLQLAFRFGLEPAEYPASDVAAAKSSCSRGALGADPLELFGEDTDSPPRWAMRPDARNIIIYTAWMPQPQAANAWEAAGSPTDNGSANFKEMMVAVALYGGDEKRLIFAFFDQMPDDDRLKTLMQNIATGKGHWLVGFDVNTRRVTPNQP